ncbi:MAG TPA: hypothetical protein VK035_08930 [Kiloniellales bacterium]|nr:hypothetical protein [Kiloniellales bacterium]
MTPALDASEQAAAVAGRLLELGISNSQDRELLLARLDQQARPDETLRETLDRRLCEWLSEQLGEGATGGDPGRPEVLATAEATIVLSGIGERWPLALFDSTVRLPTAALRRLNLAVPVAVPPVVTVPMPAQPLEPFTFRDLAGQARPRRPGALNPGTR